MKKAIKNFFTSYGPAIIIGLLISVTFIATKIMITSIKDNIDSFARRISIETTADNSIAASVNTQEYIVREYEGRIGIFFPDESHPFRVEQTYVAYLPSADRESLAEGLTVYGSSNLEKLLSDLCS